jgi:hypothetical protein
MKSNSVVTVRKIDRVMSVALIDEKKYLAQQEKSAPAEALPY